MSALKPPRRDEPSLAYSHLLTGIEALTKPDYHKLNWHDGRNDRLLHAVLCAYAKYHLDNEDIGSQELSNILYHAIANEIGDEAYIEWCKKLGPGEDEIP